MYSPPNTPGAGGDTPPMSPPMVRTLNSVQDPPPVFCFECGSFIGRGTNRQLCGETFCYEVDSHSTTPDLETAEEYERRRDNIERSILRTRYRRTDSPPSWLISHASIECWNRVRFYHTGTLENPGRWYCCACGCEQDEFHHGIVFSPFYSIAPLLCDNSQCRFSFFQPPEDLL